MKKIYIILFLFVSSYAQTPNWFPLSIGNKWQWLDFSYANAKGGIPATSMILRSKTIEKDTMIGAIQYFWNDSQWMRYADNKIYIWNNGIDNIYMDFDLANGTIFNSYYNGKSTSYQIEEGTLSDFMGKSVPYKGFGTVENNPNENYLFVNNFGFAKSDYYYSGGYPNNAVFEGSTTFISSLIKDSSGNIFCTQGNVKPIITADPMLFVSSTLFPWTAKITHSYSYSGTTNSVNFIDTVYFSSYYSYKDSLNSDTLTVIVPPGNTNYYYPFRSLDTNYMKHGWVFKYKLVAIDKCLVPDTATAPDTGYYTCKWDGPTSVDGRDKYLSNYFLDQNFPNPFNPSTVISYSLPAGSYVKLIIYNTLGQTVRVLESGFKHAGNYTVSINGADLPSGIYFYRLEAGQFTQVKKMMLLK